MGQYSQAIIKHLTAILTAMAIKGFTAKMTDIEECYTLFDEVVFRLLYSFFASISSPPKNLVAFFQNKSLCIPVLVRYSISSLSTTS
jgi:hypothetical protein